MKTVKAIATLLVIQCPDCDDTVINPDTGSYDWNPSDLTGKKFVQCQSCNKKFGVPNRVYMAWQ